MRLDQVVGVGNYDLLLYRIFKGTIFTKNNVARITCQIRRPSHEQRPTPYENRMSFERGDIGELMVPFSIEFLPRIMLEDLVELCFPPRKL